MRRGVVLGVVLFFVAVVLLEGNGYVIHHDLYKHGLRYSESWAWKDNLIKMALYQFVIFTLLVIHKSWRVWVLTEVFWFTCSQDLLFMEPRRFPSWGLGVAALLQCFRSLDHAGSGGFQRFKCDFRRVLVVAYKGVESVTFDLMFEVLSVAVSLHQQSFKMAFRLLDIQRVFVSELC